MHLLIEACHAARAVRSKDIMKRAFKIALLGLLTHTIGL